MLAILQKPLVATVIEVASIWLYSYLLLAAYKMKQNLLFLIISIYSTFLVLSTRFAYSEARKAYPFYSIIHMIKRFVPEFKMAKFVHVLIEVLVLHLVHFFVNKSERCHLEILLLPAILLQFSFHASFRVSNYPFNCLKSVIFRLLGKKK